MAARRLGLCLVGFGTVGQALVRLIETERERLLEIEALDLQVSAVATRRFGHVHDSGGLDVDSLLRRAERRERHGPAVEAEIAAATLPGDIVVETMPLEPHTGGAAIAVTRAALLAGRSVVSANKGPVAHACAELRSLARERGVHYRFESAVADGLPVFSLVERTLPVVRMQRIVATLNSTSNVVLAGLAEGAAFQDAVAAAQAAGIAEADVSYDLESWDAAVKLSALAGGLWEERLPPASVSRAVVDASSAARARECRRRGTRLMSIATLERGHGGMAAEVRIDEVAPGHPFSALEGASLALRFESETICPVTIASTNPTPTDTAYGLLADVVEIARATAG